MKVYLKDWVMHKINVYGYCQEETHESHLNVTGVQFFRLNISNILSNLTQFRPSEIHCQPDPTERNGSLRHLTIRNVFRSLTKATLESRVFIKLAKLEIISLKSP